MTYLKFKKVNVKTNIGKIKESVSVVLINVDNQYFCSFFS